MISNYGESCCLNTTNRPRRLAGSFFVLSFMTDACTPQIVRPYVPHHATIRSASQADSLAWFLRHRDRLSFAAGSQHAFHTCAGCDSHRRQRIIPVDHIPQSPRKQHRREIRVLIFSSFLFGLFVHEIEHRQLPHHKTSATRGAMWPTALSFTHAQGKGTK